VEHLKNSWLFPAIQSLHVVGLALFAGTLAMRDSNLKSRVTSSGLALLLSTGLVLFFADSARYVANSAFLLKLILVASGLLFEYLLRSKWRSRAAAAVSVALWSAVVIASRLVADFDK
jgi:hypothetical protein